MTYILIDPLIVMTPPDDATAEEVSIWFNNLSTWLNEALAAPFSWLHYLNATLLVQERGRFPDFKELQHLQRRYRLDINIRQISRSINDFFRDEDLDLVGHINRLDFIVESVLDSIHVQPVQFITRLPDSIQNDFYIQLANCCVCKHISLPLGRMLHIATFALPDNTRTITVSTVILAVEPDSICNEGDCITQAFPLVITPDDLPPLGDIITIWSEGEKSIVYTLQQNIRKEVSVSTMKPFAFRLGPRFIQSITERGLDTNEIVLRSIMRAAIDIVLNRAKDRKGYALHDLRLDKTADSPRRMRASDGGQAWRLKLQQSGAGWRLHYWHIPTAEGSVIEFANVCKESESEIY